jgi:hypothetical protein
MCKNLDILVEDKTAGAVYNNITLAEIIKEHETYGSIISKEDDMKYGLKPCLNHKSIAPIVSNKSHSKKSKNKVTLKEPEHLIWKCGVLNKSLVEFD